MLKQELKSFLSDTIEVDLEQLKAALTSDEEVEVKFKSGTLLDDAGLTGLKETVKKEGYNEGKVTGVEMEAKRVKEKFGIDVEGKNFDAILSIYEKNILANAKIEPDKKVKDLSASLTNLQKQYETDLGLKDNEIKNLSSEIGNYKINGELTRHLPDGLTGIKPNQFATLAKTEYGFGYEDGTFVAKRGDIILKDKVEKPLPVKDVLTDYAIQNGWVASEGRGAGDNAGSPSGFKTEHDVMKYMDENKIDPLSSEGVKLMADFNNSNK
ncbi:MAG: hypothetical protein H8E34_10450 [Bacteroidetes bacterium]|nr:hypothetical protein [Bacteroidota bacterium]